MGISGAVPEPNWFGTWGGPRGGHDVFRAGVSSGSQARWKAVMAGRRPAPPTAYDFFDLGFSTRRLFCTGPKLRPAVDARIPATFLSSSLFTTPSSVTCPFFTMM